MYKRFIVYSLTVYKGCYVTFVLFGFIIQQLVTGVYIFIVWCIKKEDACGRSLFLKRAHSGSPLRLATKKERWENPIVPF
jgi:hypothetical protein